MATTCARVGDADGAFAGLGLDVTAFRAAAGTVSGGRPRGRDGLAALAIVFQHLDVVVRGRRLRAGAGVLPARWPRGAMARDLAGPARGAGARGRHFAQPGRRPRIGYAAARGQHGEQRDRNGKRCDPPDARDIASFPATAVHGSSHILLSTRRFRDRDRNRGHGPTLSVRRHRRRWRRLRLLGAHPVRVRSPWHHAAATQRGSGA